MLRFRAHLVRIRTRFLLESDAYDYPKANVKSDLNGIECEMKEMYQWGTDTILRYDPSPYYPTDVLGTRPLSGIWYYERDHVEMRVDPKVGAKGFVAR